MTATLNTLSPVDPIKAMGFYSFVVTIPTGEVYSFAPKGTCGFILLATNGSSHQGGFWFRGTLVAKSFGGASTVAGTGVLTGASGGTNTTVSSSGGVIYIENLSGTNYEYTVILLTENASFE